MQLLPRNNVLLQTQAPLCFYLLTFVVEALLQSQETVLCDDGQALQNETATPPCCWDDSSGTRFFLDRDGLCKMCEVCTPGYQHDKPCGNGKFGEAVCIPCAEGYYSSKDGYDCLPCRICEYTEILQECTTTTDRDCGACIRPGYYLDPQNPDLCNQNCEDLSYPEQKPECWQSLPRTTKRSSSKHGMTPLTDSSDQDPGSSVTSRQGYGTTNTIIIILLVCLIPTAILLLVIPICIYCRIKRSQDRNENYSTFSSNGEDLCLYTQNGTSDVMLDMNRLVGDTDQLLGNGQCVEMGTDIRPPHSAPITLVQQSEDDVWERRSDSEGIDEVQDPTEEVHSQSLPVGQSEGSSEGIDEVQDPTEGEVHSQSLPVGQSEGSSEKNDEVEDPTEGVHIQSLPVGQSEGSSEKIDEVEDPTEGEVHSQSLPVGQSEGSSEKIDEVQDPTEGEVHSQSLPMGQSEGSCEKIDEVQDPTEGEVQSQSLPMGQSEGGSEESRVQTGNEQILPSVQRNGENDKDVEDNEESSSVAGVAERNKPCVEDSKQKEELKNGQDGTTHKDIDMDVHNNRESDEFSVIGELQEDDAPPPPSGEGAGVTQADKIIDCRLQRPDCQGNVYHIYIKNSETVIVGDQNHHYHNAGGPASQRNDLVPEDEGNDCDDTENEREDRGYGEDVSENSGDTDR